jgi:hypothetical protein
MDLVPCEPEQPAIASSAGADLVPAEPRRGSRRRGLFTIAIIRGGRSAQVSNCASANMRTISRPSRKRSTTFRQRPCRLRPWASPSTSSDSSSLGYFFANLGDLRIERKLFDYTGKFVTGNRGSSRLALRGLIGWIPAQLVFCNGRSVHADQRVTRDQHRSWRHLCWHY